MFIQHPQINYCATNLMYYNIQLYKNREILKKKIKYKDSKYYDPK